MYKEFLNDLDNLYQDIRYLDEYEDMTFREWCAVLDELQESLNNVDGWYDRNFNIFIENVIDIKNVDPLVRKTLKEFHNEFLQYHNINIKNAMGLNSIIMNFVDLDKAIIDILDIFNY